MNETGSRDKCDTAAWQGDVVAVMLENRVDYCCYWLGLAVLGAVPALINTNLRHQALAHTLTVVTSKAVIFSADMEKCDIALSLSFIYLPNSDPFLSYI